MTAPPLRRIPHFVDGTRDPGADEQPTGNVYDPAAGEVTAVVGFASADDVDRVVGVATRAARAWRDSSLARRTSVLFALRELIHTHRDELAALITAEHGKVLADAAGEVQRGLEVVEFACGIPTSLAGRASQGVSTSVDSHSVRQPVGVVGVISPFNFPFMVPMWFVPVAIACGNAVVLKPSEKDPSVSVRMAELWIEAGLPAGVFNVVHGSAATVDAMLAHPAIASISFVGSTPVAKHVYAAATAAGKRVQALGGAKNHMVVLPDADLDGAADAAVSAAYGSAGERCMAISVVVAVEPGADTLVEKIRERTTALRIGDGRRGCDMGPLISRPHRDRVESYVDAAERDGAKLVVDGRGVDVDGAADGFWLGPTLVDHVQPSMSVYTDEVFGPVLSVVRVDSFDAALALLNRNPYGNGAAVFTRDGGIARRFEVEVEAGMVGINVPIPVPMAYFSFGGSKSSLFGDLHAHGAEGVQFFTRGKVVTTRWPEPPAGVDLSFPRGS